MHCCLKSWTRLLGILSLNGQLRNRSSSSDLDMSLRGFPLGSRIGSGGESRYVMSESLGSIGAMMGVD